MHQSTPEIKPVQNTYHTWGDNSGTEFIGNKQTLKNTQLYILVHIYISVFFMLSREAVKMAVLLNLSLFSDYPRAVHALLSFFACRWFSFHLNVASFYSIFMCGACGWSGHREGSSALGRTCCGIVNTHKRRAVCVTGSYSSWAFIRPRSVFSTCVVRPTVRRAGPSTDYAATIASLLRRRRCGLNAFLPSSKSFTVCTRTV